MANYMEREAYVIVYRVYILRHYLLRYKFTVYTDNKPLFTGNCVVIRNCSCSLKANSFYIPSSLEMRSYPGFPNEKQVPNIMAIWSYFKSVKKEADSLSNRSILNNDHFSLP